MSRFLESHRFGMLRHEFLKPCRARGGASVLRKQQRIIGVFIVDTQNAARVVGAQRKEMDGVAVVAELARLPRGGCRSQ